VATRIAFLRGINVGGHNVTMPRLRELIAEIGVDDVETFIASGNVIFDGGGRSPKALEAAIEDKLASALGYEVATMVRTPAQLAKLAAVDVFARRPGTLHAVFLKKKPAAAGQRAVDGLQTTRDKLHVAGTEILWSTAGGFSETDIKVESIVKALGGDPVTVRNMNTVRKLAAKYCS
jgi:uncharacterized protein (DUF1697 family)